LTCMLLSLVVRHTLPQHCRTGDALMWVYCNLFIAVAHHQI
jgi:hypothetical protein